MQYKVKFKHAIVFLLKSLIIFTSNQNFNMKTAQLLNMFSKKIGVNFDESSSSQLQLEKGKKNGIIALLFLAALFIRHMRYKCKRKSSFKVLPIFPFKVLLQPF